MGKIFLLGGLCSVCPFLATWRITRKKLRANYRRIAFVKSKVTTKCKIFLKIVGYVDESLMISFLPVYEFYRIHKNIGTPLQNIATNAFSAVGFILHFSSFRQNST